MARPSKLSPAQWEEIKRRLANGEGVRALSREFGVSPGRISSTVSKQAEQVKAVANQLVAAESALCELSVPEQRSAISLAEMLRQVGQNMARAAVHSAATAHRMHALANQEAQKIDDADPLANRDALMGVQALTKMGNDAGLLPMQVIGLASKSQTGRQPMDDDVIEDPADVPDEVLIRIAMGQR